jgi:predicted AAA+ superfamily ATPase
MESFVETQTAISTHTLNQRIEEALQAAHGLTLLSNVLSGATAQTMLKLLQNLVQHPGRPEQIALAYSETFAALAEAVNTEAAIPDLADAWQGWLVARLLDDRNPWSSQVERVGLDRVSQTLRTQARYDLRALQRFFALDARTLWESTRELVIPALPALREAWTPWLKLAPASSKTSGDARELLAAQFVASPDWGTLVEPLEAYWAKHGTGPQARYHMLYWSGNSKELVGITHPDPVRLSNLIAQERQQKRLVLNIERFLTGLPAQDMLLYGPPGTGKSSTIKALANTYADQGLCLVEVNKADIGDLPQVGALLRGRAPRYLLFIDDLSFEEHETSYKALKVLLEGTATVRPANVLICATSNRLNLIQERFSERGQPSEDVNWRDTMDEKQSLAHRFALRVTFLSPDQQGYLRIVENLARQRGLALAADLLQERALAWERQHSGRSGRVARQFIDDLEAELKSR